jgi:hypothetical protein
MLSRNQYRLENFEVDLGHITCPDCIEVLKFCQNIDPKDFMPEYENELHSKHFSK